MWELVIISLISGQIVLSESPFKGIDRCEARKTSWTLALDPTYYRVECIPFDSTKRPQTPQERQRDQRQREGI